MPHQHFLPGTTIDFDAETMTIVSCPSDSRHERDVVVLTADTLTRSGVGDRQQEDGSWKTVELEPETEEYVFIGRLAQTFDMSVREALALHAADLLSDRATWSPKIGGPFKEATAAVDRHWAKEYPGEWRPGYSRFELGEPTDDDKRKAKEAAKAFTEQYFITSTGGRRRA
jgi:hypothetical protein